MMRNLSRAALVSATAMTLVLAACDQRPAAIDAPAPAPLEQLAATTAGLPYAEPAPVQYRAPQEGYRWAERAYGVQRAVYDAPPDYGFDYGDEEALAWDTADDWSMYAEPWDGGYRYYYYEPGAAQPYFIRDQDYGYGYDPAGVLVGVFDSGGRYVSRDVVYRVAPAAGRYYHRGRELRSAARQSRRVQIDDRAWVSRAPLVERSADPWLRAAREQSDWRAWRERNQDRELRRFEREQRAREKDAGRWRERRAALESAGPRTAVDFPNRAPDYRQAQPARDERWRQAQAERQAQQQARQAQAETTRRQQADQQRAQAQRQAAQQQQAQARGQARAEAQRQQVQDRRQAEQRADAARRQQGAEQRQQAQAQRQAQAAEQRQRAQAQSQAQQQQARQQAAEQRRQAQAQRQGQQAAEQQARRQAQAAEQRQRAQAQGQAQQQQARQQAAEQRQQAQAQRQTQQVAEQQARQQAQAQRQARAAEAQAKPAAAEVRGDGKPDKPRGRQDKKE